MSDLVGKALAGRCSNGHERDHGRVIHAVQTHVEFGPALCGVMPGRRSSGWTSHPLAIASVTCPKCLKKLSEP